MGVTGQGSMDLKVAQGCYHLGNGGGSADYVTLTNLGAVTPDSGNAVSVSCWFKVNDLSIGAGGTWLNLVGKDESSKTWGLGIDDTSRFVFHVSGAGGGKNRCFSAFGLNKWYHLVGTYAGGDKIGGDKTISLYVDSHLVDSGTSPSGISGYHDNDVYIGAGTGSPVSGLIHDVRIWSGACLTADEVVRVYNGLDVQKPKLIGHYKFKDRRGTNLKDYSKNNYDGTITGGEWYPRDIRCWCNRWQEDGNNVVIETMMDACDRNYIFNQVIPGEIRENINSLGWQIIRDGTFKSGNTLIFTPVSNTGLDDCREERICVVRNIQDWFVNPYIFGVKIEGMRVRKYADYI